MQSTPIREFKPELQQIHQEDFTVVQDFEINDAEGSLIQDVICGQQETYECPFEVVSREATDVEPTMISESDVFTQHHYGDLTDEKDKITEMKCIASITQLKKLLGRRCHFEDCNEELMTINEKYCGFCIKLDWCCNAGHRDIWYSSPFYAAGLSINYIIQSALLLSGGQLNQFQRFCKFANIGNCSSTSFHENQRLFVAPTVQQEFNELRESIIDEMRERGTSVVVCGDGRMDSPGHTATKGSYTLMDYSSKKLLTMECGDKREVRD